MAVARDDLRRDRLALEAEPRQDALLEVRGGRRVRADRARHGPTDTCSNARSSRDDVARRLHRVARELDAERRRLGVDAVRAADADRVHMLARALGQRLDQRSRPGEHDPAGRLQLQARRGVEHVRRRQAEVDPAPRVTRRRAQHVDERGDVVVGRALALVDGLDGERRAADRVELVLGRPLHRLARRDLDAPPRLHAGLVGPQRAHLRAGVASDHRGSRVSDLGSDGTPQYPAHAQPAWRRVGYETGAATSEASASAPAAASSSHVSSVASGSGAVKK